MDKARRLCTLRVSTDMLIKQLSMDGVEIVGASMAQDGMVELVLTGPELPEVGDGAPLPSMTAIYDAGVPFVEALRTRW